jgi:hypothetical protein
MLPNHPNQNPGFLPNVGAPTFNLGITPPSTGETPPAAPRPVPGVQLNDIYQAAKKRAVEEHELDKLFNPEFYGDAI